MDSWKTTFLKGGAYFQGICYCYLQGEYLKKTHATHPVIHEFHSVDRLLVQAPASWACLAWDRRGGNSRFREGFVWAWDVLKWYLGSLGELEPLYK